MSLDLVKWRKPFEFLEPYDCGQLTLSTKVGIAHYGPIFQPIWTRWMAEIAHPDRMQLGTRQALRDRLMTEFHYRLTDDQIDAQAHIDENEDSAGYERFTRNYRPSN